jgi:hypothetical protein
MTTQVRRTWNAGDIPTATDFNACVRDANIFAAGIPIVGATGLSGNAGGGGFLIQAGQTLQTTNAAGGVGFNFPTAFPNGILTVLVMVADSAIGNVAYAASQIPQTQVDRWGGLVYTNAGAWANAGVRLNYIAIGW